MYRVGDYVYFENSSSNPYLIRRIEELNKTANGNVEAKVVCLFRRRDISGNLNTLADSNAKSQGGGRMEVNQTTGPGEVETRCGPNNQLKDPQIDSVCGSKSCGDISCSGPGTSPSASPASSGRGCSLKRHHTGVWPRGRYDTPGGPGHVTAHPQRRSAKLLAKTANAHPADHQLTRIASGGVCEDILQPRCATGAVPSQWEAIYLSMRTTSQSLLLCRRSAREAPNPVVFVVAKGHQGSEETSDPVRDALAAKNLSSPGPDCCAYPRLPGYMPLLPSSTSEPIVLED
ncbi:thyrotropin receptor-like protein [Lates japonicus]|uniref:Thyrotropin receptor-like protein n=1 Tax=Lates japonicus TaxID=270547 RepID=A0AAD3RJ30_LATJO|nr:thyrotropin receptor-like protein [Lates japonicus]